MEKNIDWFGCVANSKESFVKGEEEMIAGIYVRVSTEKQDLKIQLLALRDYCKNKNYKIFKEYQDIISGKTDKRPQFDEMIKDMRKNKFDVVLVYKLDRVGRSLQNLLNLFSEFKNNNVGFISITQAYNSTTPEGKLMLRMAMLLTEYEREMIVARTKDKLDYYKNQIKKKGFFITKEGKKITSLGRPSGSKDKKRRKKGGYFLRYNK